MGKDDNKNVLTKLKKAVKRKGAPILHPNAQNKVNMNLFRLGI